MSVESPAQTLLRLLEQRGETLATAESLTAGLVSATIADVPAASAVLRGGVAAYASDVKVTVLDVPAELVATYGVVSAECAEAMAVGANGVFGTDWALSTTGVAGPTEQEGQPVGTVYVAVAHRTDVRSRRLDLSGSRPTIRRAAVDGVLALLAEALGD